jgi:hypothetical protein
MEEMSVQCCSCGETINRTSQEPVECSVCFRDGTTQGLWCHVDCLGSRLHPGVPFLTRADREITPE